MKVLVTGAAGNVGKHLVPALLKEGHSVRASVLDTEEAFEAFKGARVEVMQLDFAEAEQPAFDTLAKGVDAVVHLAAVGVVNPNENRERIFKINVEATKKLLSACRKSGVKRFVFISSSALFHRPSKLPVEENDAPSPGNAYGESKLEAEEAVKESGVPFVILRPVVVYGPGFENSFAPIVKAVQKQKMPIVGDGGGRFPVVHVLDLVDAILLSLEKKRAVGETFNISGEALTQKQWFELIAKELKVPAPKKKIPVWVAKVMALFYEVKGKVFGGKSPISRESVRRLASDRVFSTKKAERILGWKAKVDCREGLNELIFTILDTERIAFKASQ